MAVPLVEPTFVKETRNLRVFTAPGVKRIIVLPSGDFPASHYVPANWNADESARNVGHTRVVRVIRTLVNGQPTGIVVKEPETALNADPKKLARGDIWRSRFPNAPTVRIDSPTALRRLTVGEAHLLDALMRRGVPVEEPQAVVITKKGKPMLVAKALTWHPEKPEFASPTLDEIHGHVRALGLKPEDLGRDNTGVDVEGIRRVYDVIRAINPKYRAPAALAALERLMK